LLLAFLLARAPTAVARDVQPQGANPVLIRLHPVENLVLIRPSGYTKTEALLLAFLLARAPTAVARDVQPQGANPVLIRLHPVENLVLIRPSGYTKTEALLLAFLLARAPTAVARDVGAKRRNPLPLIIRKKIECEVKCKALSISLLSVQGWVFLPHLKMGNCLIYSHLRSTSSR